MMIGLRSRDVWTRLAISRSACLFVSHLSVALFHEMMMMMLSGTERRASHSRKGWLSRASPA